VEETLLLLNNGEESIASRASIAIPEAFSTTPFSLEQVRTRFWICNDTATMIGIIVTLLGFKRLTECWITTITAKSNCCIRGKSFAVKNGKKASFGLSIDPAEAELHHSASYVLPIEN
jgi:hypothetical protein